jgi:pre-rRNA-processing protein TSR1
MSVLNLAVSRDSEYTEPIKSKDPVIMYSGFRRHLVHPVYSQNSRSGKGTNNCHKFDRFFQHGESTVATVYAPIHFSPLPVMFFKPETDFGSHNTNPVVVATGSVLDVGPNRIVVKRIILTGHPFKIYKKRVVSRYMFFNREDINWFKPVELVTKYGRKGHIKESLGTHGYMKCVFDGGLKQHDTICMYLYKRVFPKWNTALWVDEQRA